MNARRLASAAALCLVMVAAGCMNDPASQGSEPQQPVSPTSSVVVDGFDSKDTLIMLSCTRSREDFTTTVTLSAISAKDGRALGRRQVVLPELARDADEPCSGSSFGRQLFNADFSQVAVLVPGPNGSGQRAVAVDVRSGAVLGPTPSSGGFSSSPDHGSPAFHPQTGELWYVDDNTDQVQSRQVEASDKDAVDRGKKNSNEFVFSGNTIWFMHWDVDWFVANPSGIYAAFVDNFGMQLWRHGASEHEASYFPGQNSFNRSLGGMEVPFGCEPMLWLDDHNLLCKGRVVTSGPGNYNFFWVTLSANYQSVENVQPLLPQTDREIYNPVLSPDRTAIAFVSSQGDDKAIYRQGLTAKTEPTRITDLAAEKPLIAWR